MARLIVFDIDGTLTGSTDVDTRCYARVMSDHLGVPIDTCWSNYRHVTDSGIAAELFGRHGRPLDELPLVRDRFIAMVERELSAAPYLCAEKPGAGKMLSRLTQTSEFRVGLATGGWSGSARAKLRCAAIDVDGVPTASAGDALARADIMTICRDRVLAGVPASETVYVGDGLWDAVRVFPDFRDVDAFVAAL